MPLGRPKKTLDDLPEGWEAEALELYKAGASDTEIKATVLDISDDLWYRLIKEEPTFSGAIKRGRGLAQSWWEKNGRSNLENQKFNPTLWYMNMRNRYKWADRHDHTTDGEKIEYNVVNYATQQKPNTND